MIPLSPQSQGRLQPFASLRGKTVIVFSAHCDDAAIGCGGTVQRIAKEAGDGCTRIGIVFSGGDNPSRADEEREAMAGLGVEMKQIYNFPDTKLPDHWFAIKQCMLTLREEIGSESIGLVLCPRLEDRHQDHRVIAENVWRIFRQHLILEYEIAKYEADLGQPNIYVSLDGGEAERKVKVLLESSPSRHCHHWWSADTFYSLMHLRGIESNCTYAEGLYGRKLVV